MYHNAIAMLIFGIIHDLIHNFISQIIYQMSLDSWFIQIKICLLCLIVLSKSLLTYFLLEFPHSRFVCLFPCDVI